MHDDPPILPSGDGHHDRMDLALIRRASRQGWAIPDDLKRVLPRRMAQIVADPASSKREATGAFQALRMASADNFNQMVEVYKLENPAAAAGNQPGLTVNVGTVNATVMNSLAADPDRFREFARLAAAVNQPPPQPPQPPTPPTNARNNGTH